MSIAAKDFDLPAYISEVASTYDLGTPLGRQQASVADPLAFALIYLPHHLMNEGKITLSDAHLEWVEYGKNLINNEPSRDVFVAPRSCGKSTWFFLILPMWAAAFGYVKFVGAVASAASQAQQHLKSFRGEFDSNDQLSNDFPKLCTPARQSNGRPSMDNESNYQAQSGFVFQSRGIDTNILGMKVGNLRPDFLVCDDIEPDESNYSAYQVELRRITLEDTVLALNDKARVVLCGTVTMSGSIIHQLTRSLNGQSEQWIDELKPPFTVHHHKPIIVNDDGSERSIWPARWPIEYLQSIRYTRSYLKNFANDPAGSGGDYWASEDFKYEVLEGITSAVLSIDPAVTTNKKSDYSAMAIVGVSPSANKCEVMGAWQVKLGPVELRNMVIKLLSENPLVTRVIVETNQGGDVWTSVFHDLPVKLELMRQTEKKEERAAKVLNVYQQGKVVHSQRLPALEEQMIGFPNAPHDDLVDACGSGINFLLEASKRKRSALSNKFRVKTSVYA